MDVEEYTNETHILLYPNPVSHTLNINLEDAVEDIDQIRLVDNLGRCSQTLSVESALLNLDCSTYAPGIYYVNFINNDGKQTDSRKIIIK